MTQDVNEIKKPIKINYKPFEFEDDNLYHEELNKITDDTFANAATTKTIKNIREVLVKTLKKKYKITDKAKLTNIANELLKIHGLNEEKFDFIKSFSTFMAEKLNDVSIDDNSNKNEKSIKGLLKDCELSADKIIGYDMLYRTMKELYGQDEAKFLSGEMYDYSLGLADSSNILLPYCWALDASKLVTSGRNFGVLPSKPCKSVASYISALCETIHQMASHLAGAIAIGSFFLDITHLMVYKQRISLKDLREDKRIRKQLENEFQQFVHSVNFLSRNGSESPFTNVSIFDKEKLAALIDDDNYGWYFPKNTKVLVDNDLGGEDYKLTDEEYKKFIIDYIFEAQKVFIEFFDKGDPMNNGLQYRFPVCFPKEQGVIINGKLTTFGDAFGEYDSGWTSVDGLTTIYKNKPIKINKVYKGKSNNFIKFNSSYGTPITVTPEHKLQLVSGELKCAKDINVGDRINLFCSVNKTSIKDTILVSDYISNLYVLGYKVKLTDNTKNLFKWNNTEQAKGSLHNNFKKSHPLDSIRQCKEQDIILKPKVEFVKTAESKQKGAIKNTIVLDEDFGRFLGLYYAEGHNSNGELAFSLNKSEVEYINFINTFVKDKLGIQHITVRESKVHNGVQVIINSRTLGLLLDNLIGKYCYHKKLNSDLFETPVNFRVGLLRGIIEGDGSVTDYSIRLTTTSKEGAYSIAYLANSLGIRANIIEPKQRVCSLNNKLEHQQYEVNFKKYDVFNYNYNLGKSTNLKKTKCLNTSGYLIKEKIEYKVDVPETVYNIEVDSKEHLFQLPNGVITSNCTVNLSKHKINGGTSYCIGNDNELLNYITKKDIARYNIFTSEGTKVASCCRLISDKDMLDMASSVNSFGGSSISLGSHRVVTVNLARLAFEADSYNDYLKRLHERTESAAKVLKAHRVLLKKLNNMGLHPFLKNYWINLSRMFSTFGMMGVVEANQILTEKFGTMDFDYTGDILTHYNVFCKEMGDKYGFIWNIEEIPGESFSVRLAESDKLIYGNPYNLDPLYSNQFVPLWKDATIYEKMEADGKYNRLLTGGGIVHIQINSDVTPTQAKAIINYAVQCGCEHFALNAVYTKCEDCGEVVKDKTHHCPKCNSKNVINFTRVVGFFVPVSSWNKVRRTWEFDRRTFVDLNEIDKKGEEQND